MSDPPRTNAVRALPATQQVVAALELCAELEAKLQRARPSGVALANAAEMLKWDSHEDWKEAARELLRVKEELK